MIDYSTIHSIDPTIEAEVGVKINNTARRKILLVEDDEVASMVEAGIMKLNGYEVTTVISGEKAIEAIRTDPSIDLVLMDIELGEGIDGTEAARQILKVRNLPIVFITLYTDQEIVELVRGITRYGYVMKNSGSFVLLSSIEMAFELFEAHENVERKNEELTEANRKLQKSEARYHSLFQNMLEGYACCKMLFDDQNRPVDFVYLDVNHAFEQMTGLKNVVGKSATEAIPGIKELNPELFEIYARVALTGRPEKFETDFKPWDICFSISVYSTEKGYFVATFDNITERRREENALRESEARYHKLFETVADGVLIADNEDRQFRYANKAICRMLGYTEEELRTLGVRGILPKDALPYATAEFEAQARGDKTLASNIPCLRKDGTIFYADINSAQLTIDGRACTLGIFRDITERRKAEEKLLQSKEELHILSIHLQNVREEERTSIAREIHDELGQILTSLKMDLTWLRRKLPEQQKHLHSRASLMCDDINSAINTVHSVLTRLRPFILDDFGITAVIRWHTGDWQARTGISCALSLSSEEIPLPGEVATVLFRIFQEALANIARHADATEVKVSLMEKERTIELSIKDNGRGITEKQSKGPAALGILGMKERACALGGEVDIHGAKGKGTTLKATFPLEKR